MRKIFTRSFAMLLSVVLLLTCFVMPQASAVVQPADIIFHLDFTDYQSYAPIKDSVSGVTLMESGLSAEEITDGNSMTRNGVRLTGDKNQNGIQWTSDVLDPMRKAEDGFTLNMWVYFIEKSTNTQFFAFSRNCSDTTRNDLVMFVHSNNNNSISANTCYDQNDDAHKMAPFAKDGMVFTKNWYMITLTQDPSDNRYYIYINGQDATKQEYVGPGSVSQIANTAADTAVATYAIGGHTIWDDPVMNGYLSGCTMYNRALTPEEIGDLYQGLTYEVADYTAVNEALATIPSDLSVYTTETADAAAAARDAVVYGLPVEEQERVDAMAKAIRDAVEGLELNVADGDQEAAAAVAELIQALPEVESVTKEDAETVYAVSAEYAKLSAVAKELVEGKEKLLALETQLNVLNDRYGIANLVSHDPVNDYNWTVRRNAQIGAQFYGDRTVTFGNMPAYLVGSDYIRAAQESKMWMDDDVLVEFDVFNTTYLYVGWDMADVEVPQWLRENFEETTDAVVRNDGPVLTLFRRQVTAGEHIQLGYLGSNNDIYMVMLQTVSPELPAPEAPPQKELTRVVKVACVGDSITYGSGSSNRDVTAYPPQLGLLLGDSYEVKNFGLGGATLLNNGDKPYIRTTQYTDSLSYQPDIVIIMLGTNDSKSANNSRIATEFKRDYLALIASYQALPSNPKIYVATSPFSYQTASIIGTVIANQIVPLQKEIAEEAGLDVVDMYAATYRMSIFPDKVHPNDEGYQLVARTFYDALFDYLPDDVAEVGGEANFDGVDRVLAAAAAVDRTLYTEDSLAKLEEAVENANALNRQELTYEDQATIATLVTAVQAALDGLKLIPLPADFNNLDEILQEVEGVDRTLYTEDSLAKLDDAVTSANALDRDALTSEDQAAIDALVAEIRTAIDQLEEIPDDVLLGDMNEDGSLSVTDVVLLRKAILAGSTAEQEPLGDINEDGSLSVTDVVLLRKAILSGTN